jgi:hypothetical protein
VLPVTQLLPPFVWNIPGGVAITRRFRKVKIQGS